MSPCRCHPAHRCGRCDEPATNEAQPTESNETEQLKRDAVNQYKRDYYLANAELIRSRARVWHAANRGEVYDRVHRRKYGISLVEKSELLAVQNQVCACCGTSDPGDARGWHTEHDHATGLVRGITCRLCNVTLGALGDDAEAVIASLAMFMNYLTVVAPLTQQRLQTIREKQQQEGVSDGTDRR